MRAEALVTGSVVGSCDLPVGSGVLPTVATWLDWLGGAGGGEDAPTAPVDGCGIVVVGPAFVVTGAEVLRGGRFGGPWLVVVTGAGGVVTVAGGVVTVAGGVVTVAGGVDVSTATGGGLGGAVVVTGTSGAVDATVGS